MIYKITGFLIGVLLAILTGCTHVHEGKIVKMKDGRCFLLRDGSGDERYFLIEIDSTDVNFIRK